MTTNVLVVGGAGYIGGAVTDILIEKNIPFSVYDNLLYEHHYLKPVDFMYGDIRDSKKLSKLFKKYTHIIWLAAIVGDGACALNPAITQSVNQDTVEFLSRNYSGRIIFTSTCSVYGKSTRPVRETSKTNPLSVYAQTKLAAESYLKNTNSLIFRLGTAYGLSDTYSRIRMDLAINYMTMNAVRSGSLNIFGGKQWRPFIHVKDIGRFIVENLNTKHRGIYNLATENATIWDIAQAIKKETGCRIQKTDQKFQDNRSYHAIVDKGLKDQIFTTDTKHTIAYGAGEVKQLIREHRIQNLEYEMYSNERYLLANIQKYETNSTTS